MSGAFCGQKVDLAGRQSWCVSNDPEFAAKAAEIVGLYLDPPDGALVIAVDEKPHIQALERAQGYLRLPNGRALTDQAHDYKRQGTSTLFAALNLANGEVTARHYKRRRRLEFLDFMRNMARHILTMKEYNAMHPQLGSFPLDRKVFPQTLAVERRGKRGYQRSGAGSYFQTFRPIQDLMACDNVMWSKK